MSAIKALCATMDYVRGVEQASIIYSTVLKEYSVENERLENENARLRDAVDYLYGFAKTLGVDEGDMRGFGIEVDG